MAIDKQFKNEVYVTYQFDFTNSYPLPYDENTKDGSKITISFPTGPGPNKIIQIQQHVKL